MRLGWFCSTKNGLDFSHYGRHYAYSISAVWDVSPRLGYSCNTKDQRVFFHTLAFIASHEARRRMAVFAVQLAGICTRPASREALRRAAVKPRPTGISPYAPARIARSPGSRGTAPCASREACRRAAVKPRPTCFPSSAPRPMGAVWGQGALPLVRGGCRSCRRCLR